jgi:HAD superfamily hydrolase (TIGR01509 family)
MTEPKSVGAVLWDIDGTLVDSEPTHEHALGAALQASGLSLTEDARRRVLGTSFDETYAILKSVCPGIPDIDTFVAARNLAYLQRLGEIRLRDGVRQCLEMIDAAGVARAFVSNSGRSIVDANLQAVGLLSPGVVSIAREDVSRGKPDPEPYLAAARLLGVPPDRCLVIEDSATGAASGVAAGMTVMAWPQALGGGTLFPAGVSMIGAGGLASALRDALPGATSASR